MWDDPAVNIKLIETIKKYNVLYDHTMDNYCNRQVQEKHWNRVGREMNETGTACKEKWQNIRTVYSRFLRRQKLPKGAPAKPRRPYYLAEHLQFLEPFIRPKKRPEGYGEDSDNSGETDDVATSTLEEVKFELTADNLEESNADDSADEQQQTVKQTFKRAKLAKSTQKGMDLLETSFLDNCRSLNVTEEPGDSDLQFLKSLLPDMRSMDNFQKHMFKMRIMEAVGEVLYGSAPQTHSFREEKQDPLT